MKDYTIAQANIEIQQVFADRETLKKSVCKNAFNCNFCPYMIKNESWSIYKRCKNMYMKFFRMFEYKYTWDMKMIAPRIKKSSLNKYTRRFSKEEKLMLLLNYPNLYRMYREISSI